MFFTVAVFIDSLVNTIELYLLSMHKLKQAYEPS